MECIIAFEVLLIPYIEFDLAAMNYIGLEQVWSHSATAV
ncbi:hypothetical protein T11_15649 [Trichinella zimbabwensis]|uniref:Uncharacterized protein n=1 Tax=Trichinella zimbabwensis TaxID=268475 RepID=A0A0V1GD92_9BILA|nr:hypothetical protein T11_5275 [Trichinella zimbabwensis]KRY99123.1 hypothetical protein T11_15649 [Trichinella zimbabwensis]